MFKQAKGQKYSAFLTGLHRAVLFDWSLEVGYRSARSFADARGKTIVVDPAFRAEGNIMGPKPALHVFRQSSDDFFAGDFLKALKVKLSFSFLDGVHLFETLLRDFMAVEKASDPKGVIALHDCCPFSHEMTTRDLAAIPKHAWTGDVWKLIPILMEYRPDLRLTVLDAAPTGLVLVSGLDPKSKVLDKKYSEILELYGDMSLEEFGLEAFNALFDYEDTAAFMATGYPLFAELGLAEPAPAMPEAATP
ncbi:class I SAM-dependent methyltransferase [Pseudotabrizicola algicola]|uniref:Class I SAM-dependent methyltransferase n=1 Tax=Pseudotabrizicola algicola TaxID=2709381 RepID=A0A6B3RQF4_9RHOB|nr:class I SAM-dependent methyltransferase [Pseudotabrizicola algicola]NEX47483.1 class I SAM-dependent methyltransferase [Pseudotabrizicola algicola]